MRYQWDKVLETGNALIDNQHIQLFSMLNALIEAYMKGNGEAELERTLDFLNSYVVKHFADEEKMMVHSGYSDYGIHKSYHEGFKRTVRELTAQLVQNGASETLAFEVGDVVADWLCNHIKGDDFRLASHLKTFCDPVGVVE